MNDSEKFVEVDTENLEDFEDLFNNKAQAAPEKEEKNDKEDQNEDDNTDTDEDSVATEDSEEEDEEDKPQPKKKKTAQERINEITAKARQAERERDELIKRLEALENQKPKEEVKEVKTNEPTPDDVLEDGSAKYPLGEFDPKFIRDLTKFTIAQETAAAEAEKKVKEAEDAQKAEFERISNDWANKIEGIEERLPDFYEKGQELEDTFRDIDPVVGEYLASTIMSLEYGPDVLYYLSENIDEAKRIVGLSPRQATIALGRIEARFIENEPKPKKKVSQAPEPPPTLNKGMKAYADTPVDTDDLEAFEEVFFKRKK